MVHSRVYVLMLPVFHNQDLAGMDPNTPVGDWLKYFESGTGRLYGDVRTDLWVFVGDQQSPALNPRHQPSLGLTGNR